jgi:ABC-type nitrate/sulfonate/bicarbonate transport system substrate-binding protein
LQVKYAIDEFKDGQKLAKKTSFTEAAYKETYGSYLGDMEKWQAMNPVAVDKFRRRLYEKAKYVIIFPLWV